MTAAKSERHPSTRSCQRAIILSIGDELTLGQALDTHSQWLSAKLAERSIIVIEHRTLADDRKAIAVAIDEFAARCDLLIITGGLGPTEDDLTREALGDAVTPGKALIEDDAAREQLHKWFIGRGRKMPAINEKQALRPATFRRVPNPNGTAPGLAGEHCGCLIFCLPGPPREMQPMFLDHVLPALPEDIAGEVLLTGSVHALGLGESAAAERLGDLMRRDRNPLVGTTVHDSIVTARIRAQGSADWAREQLSQVMHRVREAWQPYAYGEGNATLSDSLGELLQERSLHLATAESCTGGWLGKSIVDRAGSSAYYLGGWVTYSNQAKSKWLGVPDDLLAAHGAVSEQVAAAMAAGALRHNGAQCALAITGIAGPDGGTAEKPVGTVYVSAALEGATARDRLQVHVRHFVFPGNRETVRDRSVKSAMQLLRLVLIGEVDAPLLWEAPRIKGKAESTSIAENVAR